MEQYLLLLVSDGGQAGHLPVGAMLHGAPYSDVVKIQLVLFVFLLIMIVQPVHITRIVLHKIFYTLISST